MNLTMRKMIALSLLIALAACSTTEDVMKTAPVVAFNSTQSPDQVRSCIADAHPGAFSVQPYKDGWMVSQGLMTAFGPDPDRILWVVTATKTQAGSHIEAFNNRYSKFFNAYALPCLDKLPRN